MPKMTPDTGPTSRRRLLGALLTWWASIVEARAGPRAVTKRVLVERDGWLLDRTDR